MCAVGSTKGIGRRGLQFGLDGVQIAGGQDAVRIQYNKVFAVAAFGTVVAGLAGAGVGLGVVVQVQPVGVLQRYVAARHRRTVFHHNDFEVAEGLLQQALQQFVHFVGTVVYGNDEGIAHGVFLYS